MMHYVDTWWMKEIHGVIWFATREMHTSPYSRKCGSAPVGQMQGDTVPSLRHLLAKETFSGVRLHEGSGNRG